MNPLKKLLESWVSDRLLPSVSIRILHHGNIAFSCDLPGSNETEKNIYYDIASLTKVTATLPAVLLLLQSGELRLNDCLGDLFEDCPVGKEKITILQLLTHTSGLPADFYPPKKRTDSLVVPDEIFTVPMTGFPEGEVVYSDLGMILLGLVVEKITEQPLKQFVHEQVFMKLGMKNTEFGLTLEQRMKAFPTEFCDSGQSYIKGVVHDEKAWLLGGASGHAGLFSTADDLSRYARLWLYGEGNLLNEYWREQAVQNYTRNSASYRGLGWELRNGSLNQSCGSLLSFSSFGHTGFTGTSLWVDPEKDVAIIFLTNAVHFGRNTRIRELRPILHDAVMTHLS